MPRLAVVGHQENWQQLSAIVHGIRPAGMAAVSIDDLRSIVPWIPPRTVSRFTVGAPPERLDAIFIDTFLSPDALAQRPNRQRIERVRDAVRVAEREGAALVSLGGFTSILFESDRIGWDGDIAVTTGNSLTAALIVKGVERAAALLGRDLGTEAVLVIGASGDVGSACARSLAGRVGRLMLAARNAGRLEREGAALARSGPVAWSTDVDAMLGEAGIVIAAASTAEPTFDISHCRADAIICDAGYPKNIAVDAGGGGRRLFWGGLGSVDGGFASSDGMLERFYRFPVPQVAHGCILEGVVLALSGRFESYSSGRGRIGPDAVATIWNMARGHGVGLAPLFNADGPWPEEARVLAEAAQ